MYIRSLNRRLLRLKKKTPNPVNLALFLIVCGGTFNGKTSGEIVSPNFPNNYPLGITCTWKIVVTEGSVVKLYFETVETEKTYDTITITDSYTNEFIDK